ncbi:MAG TPA: HsmA family protein [Myxococcales bacterium]|jgi:uncharacterized repeat protein (TIGR03987 family)
MLMVSTVFITLALVFYTGGVWAERLSRLLEPWHLALFWVGLTCDTLGTTGMKLLNEQTNWFSFHALTGLLAILLMAGHAVWATWTLRRGTEEAQRKFYRYSLFVWLVWLVPYVGCAVFGMI